jgi:hypothetical protein
MWTSEEACQIARLRVQVLIFAVYLQSKHTVYELQLDFA